MIGGNLAQGNTRETILEQYWVPNADDTELGSIPINTIVWEWMPKKKIAGRPR